MDRVGAVPLSDMLVPEEEGILEGVFKGVFKGVLLALLGGLIALDGVLELLLTPAWDDGVASFGMHTLALVRPPLVRGSFTSKLWESSNLYL